jgi:hypothetical protein
MRLLALTVCLILTSPALAQDKPERPRKPEKPTSTYVPIQKSRSPETVLEKDEEEREPPKGLFQIRGSYRFSFIDGTRIGSDEGFFLGDKPTADRAFRNGNGVSIDIIRWFTPIISLHYNVSHERFLGRTVTTPVNRVRFDDLEVLKTSIGPRLSLPVDVSSGKAGNPRAVEEMRGLIPYLRIGLGWAITSRVDVRLAGGQRLPYWSQTGSFLFSVGIGFEYQVEGFGVFFESGIDTFGPMRGVKEPEAKNFHVTDFPYSFGLSWRF